ncbi:MAG: hypothetical protein PHR42_01435 [Caldisericia bacterium]|nr:hypothetical protein [Caldisericia bacterium]
MSGWDAFAKYVGVQGILALVSTGAMIYMNIANIIVPEPVYSLVGLAWGFYFAKNGYAIANIGKVEHTEDKEGEE